MCPVICQIQLTLVILQTLITQTTALVELNKYDGPVSLTWVMADMHSPNRNNFKVENTVNSRYLDLANLEYPLISKWNSGPCFNMEI